jgi:hypothetical protein
MLPSASFLPHSQYTIKVFSRKDAREQSPKDFLDVLIIFAPLRENLYIFHKESNQKSFYLYFQSSSLCAE